MSTVDSANGSYLIILLISDEWWVDDEYYYLKIQVMRQKLYLPCYQEWWKFLVFCWFFSVLRELEIQGFQEQLCKYENLGTMRENNS